MSAASTADGDPVKTRTECTSEFVEGDHTPSTSD